MEENDKLHALLRLKRYERPPEGFFEDFLDDFHRRQRETLLKQGMWSLCWERVLTVLEPLRTPRAAWVAAGVYSLALLLVVTWPKPDHSRPTTVVISSDAAPPASTTPQGGPPVLVPAVNVDHTLPVGLRPGPQDSVPGKVRTSTQNRRDLNDMLNRSD